MTWEMTKQLLGLISSPANWSTPSHTPRPSTQKLQIAFQPLKPSQESTKEELPSCVFSGRYPLIKSLGKEQETQPLTDSGFREALMPGANQGQQGKEQGLSVKAQLLMPAVWIWPFRQKSKLSPSPSFSFSFPGQCWPGYHAQRAAKSGQKSFLLLNHSFTSLSAAPLCSDRLHLNSGSNTD